jgi:hypothetical protein
MLNKNHHNVWLANISAVIQCKFMFFNACTFRCWLVWCVDDSIWHNIANFTCRSLLCVPAMPMYVSVWKIGLSFLIKYTSSSGHFLTLII